MTSLGTSICSRQLGEGLESASTQEPSGRIQRNVKNICQECFFQGSKSKVGAPTESPLRMAVETSAEGGQVLDDPTGDLGEEDELEIDPHCAASHRGGDRYYIDCAKRTHIQSDKWAPLNSRIVEIKTGAAALSRFACPKRNKWNWRGVMPKKLRLQSKNRKCEMEYSFARSSCTSSPARRFWNPATRKPTTVGCGCQVKSKLHMHSILIIRKLGKCDTWYTSIVAELSKPGGVMQVLQQSQADRNRFVARSCEGRNECLHSRCGTCSEC